LQAKLELTQQIRRHSTYLRSVPVKITLRPYRPDDFETLYEIDHACYPPEIAYSRADMRAYLGFGSSECLLAEIVGDNEPIRKRASRGVNDGITTIVGFCIGAHRGLDGYIVTMDVLEPYRRQGIATTLLAEMEALLGRTGVRRISLETATDNDAGVAFWKRRGYRTRGIRKGYYPGGRDAFAMTKTIRITK
jgi:ribosomal protein S18 acetylase RimI-like enzyme